jgi:hypothetical protein
MRWDEPVAVRQATPPPGYRGKKTPQYVHRNVVAPRSRSACGPPPGTTIPTANQTLLDEQAHGAINAGVIGACTPGVGRATHPERASRIDEATPDAPQLRRGPLIWPAPWTVRAAHDVDHRLGDDPAGDLPMAAETISAHQPPASGPSSSPRPAHAQSSTAPSWPTAPARRLSRTS